MIPALRSSLATGAWIGPTRLSAGMVLFTYVSTHLLNHALGNVSLDALEAGRLVFLAFWRSTPLEWLLYLALTTHLSLVLYSLFRRRTLRMPMREAVQVVFGLSIPPLLILHVIGTRVVHQTAGLNDTYAYILMTLWVIEPLKGLQQVIALIVAWVHGCIGMHTWLNLKPGYARWRWAAFAFALVLPLLAITGFAASGREVEVLIQNPAWRERAIAAMNLPSPETAAWAYDVRDLGLYTMAALLAVVVVGRFVRELWERSAGRIRITYPGGRTLSLLPGPSVLEISRSFGIPHASVCGGKGRCSTCRVRISRGAESLPPPSLAERKVLDRVGAPEGVRLACQIRPTADLTVMPMLPPSAQAKEGFPRPPHIAGGEIQIAILFADLRGFTAFSEKKLPFDVVFVMNQYFRAMGRAVESAGGRVDKFIGDGVMALFGVGKTPAEGCRDAIAGARAMADALEALNDSLAHDLDQPLKIGVGIHTGLAIVGEMGYAEATTVTAIGDSVNTASRLESMTKEFGAQLVVSEPVAQAAGVDLSRFPAHEAMVRGRKDPLRIYAIVEPRDIVMPERGAAAGA
ncbi:MAG: adenylate/guanylate cyclase domain-containing protein [Alphaproteobacteria bacterium]|nr:adenylate/guanylate cyclase domain-containing protein [Alphaproteobacteria bacterium]